MFINRASFSFIFILMALLTACGDGATSTDSGPVSYDGNHRVSKIEYDYDNNGQVDATTIITYTNNSKTVTSSYTYQGDATPDVYISGPDAVTAVSIATFSDSGKQLSLSMQETKAGGAVFSIIFTYAYNADGSLQKITNELNGNAFEYDVNYTNGVMSSLSSAAAGQPEIILTYEADGSLKSADILNTGIVTASNDYIWRTDGQLMSINTQYKSPAPSSLYAATYDGNGKLETTVQSSGEFPANEDLNLTKTFTWTGNQLTNVEWDALSTGIVNSNEVFTWEDGSCLNIYTFGLGGAGGYTMPFFTRDQSTFFVPGIFSLNPICTP